MLARALTVEARSRGWPALSLGREQADVRDGERLRYWAAAFRPEAVFNCAAFTKVDLCESEPALAREVNGRAVANAAAAAGSAGALLVQVSTDYVFDGTGSDPYPEDAPVRPLSVYGQSKLEGERRALEHPRSLVVRTSWLFGPGGPNFVATMLGLIAKGGPLRVVDDQRGAPTYTPFLARALADLAAQGATGVVHYRNREPVTWYAFAREIARLQGDGVEVLPVTTAEFPRPAPRPAYSVLDVARFEALSGRRVEPWLLGLADYLRRGRT